MPTVNPRADNPEGIDRFDPMDDAGFSAGVQAYSDHLRALRGRPRIQLWDQEAATSSQPIEANSGLKGKIGPSLFGVVDHIFRVDPFALCS